MKMGVGLLLITALGVIIVRLVVSLIKRIINIATLKKAAKHPEYYPRTESGIVPEVKLFYHFNKKPLFSGFFS